MVDAEEVAHHMCVSFIYKEDVDLFFFNVDPECMIYLRHMKYIYIYTVIYDICHPEGPN